MKEVVKFLKSHNWDIERAYNDSCPFSFQALRKAAQAEGRESQFLLEDETGETWTTLVARAKRLKYGDIYEVVDFVRYTTLDLDRFGVEDKATYGRILVPVGDAVEGETSRTLLRDWGWDDFLHQLSITDDEVLDIISAGIG